MAAPKKAAAQKAAATTQKKASASTVPDDKVARPEAPQPKDETKEAVTTTTTAATGPGRQRTDTTGQQVDKDNERLAEERAARAGEISMINPPEEGPHYKGPLDPSDGTPPGGDPSPQEDDQTDNVNDADGDVTEFEEGETIDYTDGRHPTSQKEADEIEEAKQRKLKAEVISTTEVASATTVRIRHSVTGLVFGAGKYYDFEAGHAYKVPRELAVHLREKGIAWD